MVHIEPVELSQRGVLIPAEQVGMVIAQPFLSLTDEAPFKCRPAAKARQMQMLVATLNVAKQAHHGMEKTHFTIFPEYSIPGLDGINLIEDFMRAADWPLATVVIGGTDALSKADITNLVLAEGTHFETATNRLADIGNNQWINCAVIWVKTAAGHIERWLQPKLFPAGPEQDIQFQDMYQGKSVFTFRGPRSNDTQYNFCALVCFDWIASPGGQNAWKWVLNGLGEQVAPNELSLTWFFVIQNNDKPSHDTFLTEVSQFFNNQTISPRVHRDKTCLVFANTSGSELPGRINRYGGSSLISSGQSPLGQPDCFPTYSAGGKRFRFSTLLKGLKDAFFREGGACVHSFVQVNAGTVAIGPAGTRYAVENAAVFPLGTVIDPRVPSDKVPASIKWLNDALDHLPKLSSIYADASLAALADHQYENAMNGLRKLSGEGASSAIKLASQKSEAHNADEWNGLEIEALEHLVHTLEILGIVFATSIQGASPAHATLSLDDHALDLLAVRGDSHESCWKHTKDLLLPPRRQVLFVSRDTDNNDPPERFGNFLHAEPTQLGKDANITDPAGGVFHLGYRKLLDMFRASTSQAEIEGALRARLAA